MEDPNSVAALKKIWGYQKLEDGTLEITRYKGQATEVTVPAKIGKSIVTAIGDHAFSPLQLRIQNSKIREELTQVTFPETISKIDYYAFWCCDKLKTFFVPEHSVTAETIATNPPRIWRSNSFSIQFIPKEDA